jgi:hypothetical protein
MQGMENVKLITKFYKLFFNFKQDTTNSCMFYVHGSVYRESMSIIVQQDATIYSLLYFCKLLALHVSGGYSTHHQEHI